MDRPWEANPTSAADERDLVHRSDFGSPTSARGSKPTRRLPCAESALSRKRRLTLNVLLSFVQFEREVTAERIRDKIAASKRKASCALHKSPARHS